MRLLSLELSGFRGFPLQRSFDLDADAIVVVGANGNGKTSLFDGILWALCGRVLRLADNDSSLVSLYSETGQARSALRFKDQGTGEEYSVIRSFDGKESRVSLETRHGSYQGPSAEGRLIDLIWPDAAAASDSREALASVLTRSVYLEQDLIRQFVEAATKEERFAAVSELVGAGRVTELQSNLEQAKRAWSTVTNQRQEELRPLKERLVTIEARLADLTLNSSQASPAITSDEWSRWWQGLSAVGTKVAQVEPGSREAPSAIDSAIKQLEAVRRSTERRMQTLAAIRSEIAGLAKLAKPNLESLRETANALREQQQELKGAIAEEQLRLADFRRQQAELKEKAEQLQALAALALKHLADHCPVCDQTYDKDATRLRLEGIAKGDVVTIRAESGLSNELSELLARLAAKDKEVALAENALRSAEQMTSEWQIAQQSTDKRMSELGIGTGDRDAALEKAARDTDVMLTSVIESQKRGESLALRLAQSSALATIEDLRREAETLRHEEEDREKVVVARNQTGDLAQRIIEALREAASAVVQERLREIGPLLQGIWTRIDPHPAFRVVSFLSQVFRGKGQLFTRVSDPVEEKESEIPASVLSSSQLNALAVSVFLALNIGVPKPPLSVAMLDDPLQSLDDVNLLGLVDLFRRTRGRRQLIVSTHDGRFGNLLCRKLRPTTDDSRTMVIELDGWSRQGPSVTVREIMRDPVALRLVS